MSQTPIGQDSSVVFYRNVEITSQHTLTFSSQASQQAYFGRRVVTSVANTSYVQHNGVLKVTGSPSLLGRCNYISFTNPRYENTTIYAAINDIVYVNNSTVKVSYTVDWWQTFMFSAKYLPCQMHRESIEAGIKAGATTGAHPVLDTRIYRTNNSAPERWFYEQSWDVSGWPAGNGKRDDVYICMAISPFVLKRSQFPDLYDWVYSFNKIDTNNPPSNFHMTRVNLVPSTNETAPGPNFSTLYRAKPNGTTLYCFKPDAKYSHVKGFTNKDVEDGTIMDVGIQLFAAANRMHQIINVYYVTGEVLASLCKPLTFSYTYKPWYKEFPFNSAPYNYFGVRSPSGNINLFQYELFNHYQVSFQMQTTFAGNLTTSFVPVGYRGLPLDFDNRIDVADWPQVPYNIDGYLETMGAVAQQAIQNYAHTNSIFSNAEQKENNVFSSLINGAISGAGAVLGAVGGGIGMSQVGGVMGTAAGATVNNSGGFLQSVIDREVFDQSNNNALNWNRGKDEIDRSVTAVAYGQHRYVPGSASALYKMTGMSYVPYNVVPTHDVQISDKYVYDNYGMETPRVGLPYILSYQGISTNGTPSFNDNNPSTSYVQTRNMHCYGLPVIATNFINDMFNSGVSFILGDGR